jgi:hypothetical protein
MEQKRVKRIHLARITEDTETPETFFNHDAFGQIDLFKDLEIHVEVA